MSTLSEDKVLRINSPGFGVSSILPLGEAKPLAMYEVIVVNPTSILHLFENSSDVIKQIEVLQSDGMTSYRAESDNVIDNISAEFELRAQEMQQFLKKGGLLIIFLSPPFTVSGPEQSQDNYSWLGEWAPDRPAGPNSRNMSATIRGKAIETSTDAAQSVWVPYLKQAGLEWSTIIRLDNLTEGFVPLAMAGPNKCIAGFKSSGPKAGQVVFLPAPYGPEYDAKLKECIDRWYALHTDDDAPTAALQTLSKGLSSLLSDDDEPNLASFLDLDEQPLAVSEPPAVMEEVHKNGSKPTIEAQEEPMSDSGTPQFFDSQGNEDTGEPDKLIKKMQKNLSKPNVPDWCAKFTFDELDALRRQHENVEEQIKLAQIKAQELEERIQQLDDLKNSLLSADGQTLSDACTIVFERLGWTVKPAIGSETELWLIEDDKTQAIVRLNYSNSQPNRSELAALAESVITYWGAHEVEPKGILVASTYADQPMQDRPDDDFPDGMSDFAKRKNLCLLSTSQLLAIFRDLDSGNGDAKTVRENILTTSGDVSEFTFNKKGVAVSKR
jgi:hypothetical protein